MAPKITDEQREALARSPNVPLRLEDSATDKTYIMMDEQALPTLWEDYLRREIKKGVDGLDRGDLAALDIEATIAEARRRHQISES